MAIQIMPTAADQVTTRDVVAANVRAEAARAGFNQVRLGQRLGISQGAITKRWRGERPWQLEELDSLASALGVSVVDLVTPTGREVRLRQDSNLQPRDCVTVHILDTLGASLSHVGSGAARSRRCAAATLLGTCTAGR